jgi:hypothetical protein
VDGAERGLVSGLTLVVTAGAGRHGKLLCGSHDGLWTRCRHVGGDASSIKFGEQVQRSDGQVSMRWLKGVKGGQGGGRAW